MKKLIALLSFFVIFSSAIANEGFILRFDDSGSNVIINDSDWTELSNEENYHFSIAKNFSLLNERNFKVHSLVEFKNPNGEVYQNLFAPIKRIISYGVMDCTNGIFHLMGDIYVDKDNKVQFISQYEYGQYNVEVTSPNTPRNKAFIKVCSGGRDA